MSSRASACPVPRPSPRELSRSLCPWFEGPPVASSVAEKNSFHPQKGVDLGPPLSQIICRHTFELLSFLSQKPKYCICTQEKLYPLWLQPGLAWRWRWKWLKLRVCGGFEGSERVQASNVLNCPYPRMEAMPRQTICTTPPHPTPALTH